MLQRIAEGVWAHQSAFLQSNAVVVEGQAGVLVVDPGIEESEIACLASDLRALGHAVVAGFATHPHWDHVLWGVELGEPPRYGTARCAADMAVLLSSADWRAQVSAVLPEEIAGSIPMGLFGRITGVPDGAARIPWDGPEVRIIEHQGHEAGHAALLIEGAGVLVAGDMLSDVLIPFLNLEAADPIEDYLAGLALLEGVADDAVILVPGHGAIGGPASVRRRVELDRAYVRGLRDAAVPGDPRLVAPAPHSEWLPGVDQWQRQRLTPGAT